jgi:hypothetical protein
VPAPSAPRRHVPRAGRAKKATVSLHSRVVETHRDYYAASNVTIKRRLRRNSPQRSSSAARKETERERERGVRGREKIEASQHRHGRDIARREVKRKEWHGSFLFFFCFLFLLFAPAESWLGTY